MGDKGLEVLKKEMLNILIFIDKVCEKYCIEYWIDSGTLLGAVRHKGFIPWDDDIDICMMRDDYNKFLNIIEAELEENMEISNFFKSNNCEVTWTKIINNSLRVKEKNSLNGYNYVFVDVFPVDYYQKNFSNKVIKYLISKFIIFSWVLSGKKTENINNNLVSLLEKVPINIRKKINNFQKYILRYILKKRFNDSDIVTYGYETPFLNKWKKEWIFPLKRVSFCNKKFYAPNNSHIYLSELYGKDYMKLPPEEKRISPHIQIIEDKEGKISD